MSHVDASTPTSTEGGAGGAGGAVLCQGEEGAGTVEVQRYRPVFDTWPANKRLYRLLLGVCAVSLQPGAMRQASLLQQLVYRPDLQPLVREVYLNVPEHLPSIAYECAITCTLRNLTSLGWSGEDENGDAIVLPVAFTSSLRNLPHLAHLEFEFTTPHTFEDESFTIADLPRLRCLRLDFGAGHTMPSFSSQLLSATSSTLQALRLGDLLPQPDTPYAQIPWSTLESLELSLPSRTTTHQPQRAVLDSLASALEGVEPARLPLRRFILDDAVCGSKAFEEGTYISKHEFVELMQLLSRAGVSEIHLNLGSPLAVPPGLPALPDVRRLTLRAYDMRLTNESNIGTMFCLLRLFPAMTDLELDQVTLSDTYRYKTCPHPPDLD
ncbi:hypothetical protein JCM10213v2_006034 [Rhodosporidiobolus nylandii]